MKNIKAVSHGILKSSRIVTSSTHYSELKEERLGHEVSFGRFTVEEGDSEWTQAEVNAEWSRQKALTNMPSVTQPSPPFVQNWDFKPEPEAEYHNVSDDELALPFQYKPDPIQTNRLER